MKTREDLTEAELACLELYQFVEHSHESRVEIYQGQDSYPKAYNVGKAIAEQLKPKLKPVDMSVFIGSGIDCEFSNNLVEFAIAYLKKIKEPNYPYVFRNAGWTYCKPRMDYWFSPLNFIDAGLIIGELRLAGFKVDVEYYYKDVVHASGNWGASGGVEPAGILSFKISGLQDGYCWPWEVE